MPETSRTTPWRAVAATRRQAAERYRAKAAAMEAAAVEADREAERAEALLAEKAG